jgi:hypothetical protein
MDITKYIINDAEGSIDIIKHLTNSLPTDLLIELRESTNNIELWYYINKQINPQPEQEKTKRINPPLQQLIDTFNNSKGKQLNKVRRELQKRFDGQSFSDQELIIDTFMKKGLKTDVVWCSKYLIEEYADTITFQDETFEVVGNLLWKDEYLDVVKSYWEHDIENYKLLKVITQFDSPEYLKRKIRDIENECEGIINGIAYPSLLLKVCEDKSYPLPKGRLTPFQYAYISAKTDRTISEKEAETALAWAANNETFWPSHFVRNLQGQLVFRDYRYSTLGLALWSLSKLGRHSVIISFNEWIKTVICALEMEKHLDATTISNIIQEKLVEL